MTRKQLNTITAPTSKLIPRLLAVKHFLSMMIGGLQKFSLLDYPGHIAAIIFTQGCNFRCQFCYNPLLVKPIQGKGKFTNTEPGKKGHSHIIPEEGLFVFLAERQDKLDAVVITGGEPTIHNDLAEFIGRIRELGYKVKLDTNGTNSKMLKALIVKGLIDYIAMDIKGPANKYDKITGVQPDLREVKECIKIIMNSGLPYEFRTTVVPELITTAEIHQTGLLIAGAHKWYLQKFKSDIDLINKSFKGVESFTDKDMKKMKKVGQEYVKSCEIR